MPEGDVVHVVFNADVTRAEVAALLVREGFVEEEARVSPNAIVLNESRAAEPPDTRTFVHAKLAKVGCSFKTRPERAKWRMTCADEDRVIHRHRPRCPTRTGRPPSTP